MAKISCLIVESDSVSFPWWLNTFVFVLLFATEVDSGSLKRLGSSRLLPSDLRTLQSTVSSSLNPEGIYVWPQSVQETLLEQQGWPGVTRIAPLTERLPRIDPLSCWNAPEQGTETKCGGENITWRMCGVSKKKKKSYICFASFLLCLLFHLTMTQTDVNTHLQTNI